MSRGICRGSALSRHRGRRDTLILRGRLARPPAEDVELLDRGSWSGRDALRGMKDERWSVREPAAPGSMAAFYKYEKALGKGQRYETVVVDSRQSAIGNRQSAIGSRPEIEWYLVMKKTR